jgi:hypothetical protein
MSYHDSGLWLGFIKAQSGRGFGPRICLFASYGSPTGGPNDEAFGTGTPLPYFGPYQRVSIAKSRIPFSPSISLFYSRDEFEDALQRICNNPERVLTLHSNAMDYIFSLTSGHPAAVVGVLGMIYKVCFEIFFYVGLGLANLSYIDISRSIEIL